jgi:glycosyltransferase involved in cell wall biosynthesis
VGGRAETPEQERVRDMVVSGIAAAGWVDRLRLEETVADVLAFFAACDVVVIPDLRDAGVRIALEAAALGRPVVATRLSGMTEVIEDGHTGLLVPPNHPQALADALALLLASPALRGAMGHQARIRAEERFSLTVMVEAFEAAVRG